MLVKASSSVRAVHGETSSLLDKQASSCLRDGQTATVAAPPTLEQVSWGSQLLLTQRHPAQYPAAWFCAFAWPPCSHSFTLGTLGIAWVGPSPLPVACSATQDSFDSANSAVGQLLV